MQKAVDSATTVLVGEDTDLPLLMQAQRVMISISILNNAVKRELGEQVYSNILFHMLSLDVTQPLTSIVLVHVLHLRNPVASSLFHEQVRCLIHNQPL